MDDRGIIVQVFQVLSGEKVMENRMAAF